VIHANSASYTAWEWRWRCLAGAPGCAGGRSLAAEARWLADLAAASPKNYQLWNHRRRLAFARGPAHAAEARAAPQHARLWHFTRCQEAVVCGMLVSDPAPSGQGGAK
jgi:hypothetical protein